MSLRKEMQKTVDENGAFYKTDHGKFSSWWRNRNAEPPIKGGTYIRNMLASVESDEELELLWAKWNIEREN